MAFSRLSYDENAYKQDLYESTGTGRYQLLDKSTHRGNTNNATCFQETPEIHSNNSMYRISDQSDMVNAESDLFNIIEKIQKIQEHNIHIQNQHMITYQNYHHVQKQIYQEYIHY